VQAPDQGGEGRLHLRNREAPADDAGGGGEEFSRRRADQPPQLRQEFLRVLHPPGGTDIGDLVVDQDSPYLRPVQPLPADEDRGSGKGVPGVDTGEVPAGLVQ